jgi:trigger factor
MLVDYKDISPVKKMVGIEIPAEAVSRELDRVTSEFAHQAKIPGFRPGKIPPRVARTRFLKEIDDEVVQRLLSRFFQEAVGEKGLNAVGNPELKHMDPLVEGSPLRFDAEFEVKPQIELAEWRGIEVKEPPTEVSEAEVDRMIGRFREQSATWRPVTDRPAQEGDFATVDVVSQTEGDEPRKSENYQLELGDSAPLPELRQALIGKRIGETASFDKNFEDDAPNEEVRGRKVHYEVTLKEIQLRELPELSDDFARSLAFGESVDEMRRQVKDDLTRHREQEAMQSKRQQLADKLVELHPFDVPDSLVEEELSKSLRNYARFLAAQGVELEKAEIDWQKMGADFRPEAVKRVRRQLILEEIARREHVEVPDGEVDAEIKRAAGDAEEFAEVKHRLRHDGGYEALRLSMAQEKALDLVMKEARVSRG